MVTEMRGGIQGGNEKVISVIRTEVWVTQRNVKDSIGPRDMHLVESIQLADGYVTLTFGPDATVNQAERLTYRLSGARGFYSLEP